MKPHRTNARHTQHHHYRRHHHRRPFTAPPYVHASRPTSYRCHTTLQRAQTGTHDTHTHTLTHTLTHTHRHTHTHRDTHIYTQRDATNRITRTHGPVGCPSDHSTATALMLARSLWSAACDSSHSTPTAHVHRPIHALIRMFPAESHRARVHASCAPWCSQNHDCLANEQLQDAAKMVLA